MGAVSGKACFSEFTYGGRKWLVAQWYKDAMDAVSAQAFRVAKGACETPQESAEVIRLYAMGFFSFVSVSMAGGLETPDLLSEFLYHLLRKEQPEVTRELAREMIDDDLDGKIHKAVVTANPRYGRMLKMIKEIEESEKEASARKKTPGSPVKRPTKKSGRRNV